jgi:tetratricopeptide (TPR) repeat protein
VHDPHFAPDLREISAILSRTALKTPRRVFVATIAIVVVMGVVTGVAARAYHDARHRGARAQFEEGEAAANAGQTTQALEHYRAALALDRDHAEYRRALAIALISLRRTAEAETHLEQLLELDPVDGEANLLRARIAAGRGAFTETEAFYPRAIYGRWAAEAGARRLAARFELIEWLVQMGAVAPARAELLRLQAELPDVPFLQLELARRMLALGQPAPAAVILRRELDRRPTDASAAADLTKAEMDMGRFVEARAAARRALNLDARDRVSRDRLLQINEVLSLDPSQRGLTDPERFRRSQLLLRRVHTDLLSCAAPPAPAPADLLTALATAETLLEDEDASAPRISRSANVQKPTDATSSAATPPPAAPPTMPLTLQERIDARLAAAEALWNARIARCGAVDGPLAWIFDRVAP